MALEKARNEVIGGLVVKYFPAASRFHPQKTAADNAKEFAPLAQFLSALRADTDCVCRLRDEAVQRNLSDDYTELEYGQRGSMCKWAVESEDDNDLTDDEELLADDGELPF